MGYLLNDFAISKMWLVCYEDNPEAKAAAEAKATAEKAKAIGDDDPHKFTEEQQKHINKIVADEKRKGQEGQRTIIAELEALKKKANLTVKEKKEYEDKLRALRQSVMSKEELAKEEKDKIVTDFEKRIHDGDTEIVKWKNLYHNSTIKRALTDAAVVNKAYNPEQIVAMLQSKTQLVEVLDEDSKSTGELNPEVTYDTTDKEGKPVTLKLTVEKAVEKMKEEEKYQNLFLAEGQPGLGLQNRGTGKAIDLAELAKNPELYAKLRKEGKLDKQLGSVNS